MREFAKRKPANCIAGHGAEIPRCGANKQAKACGEAAESQNALKERLKDAADKLRPIRLQNSAHLIIARAPTLTSFTKDKSTYRANFNEDDNANKNNK